MTKKPIFPYTGAVLRETSGSWYIEYYYRRSDGTQKRVRNCINGVIKHFRKVSERRAYGLQLVADVNAKLARGWTPELEAAAQVSRMGATPWEQIVERYRQLLEKEDATEDGLRHATVVNYRSHFRKLQEWLNDPSGLPIRYVYELTEDKCRAFLDWTMAVGGVSSRTRDNRRQWLVLFCSWLKECGYVKENVAAAIEGQNGGHRGSRATKTQHYITKNMRARIFSWLEENDRRLLLAVYLCHYCFLRTKEVSMLRIEYIHIKDSQIFVPASIAKTRKDAWITLPDIVLKLMLDLKIFNHPGDAYIFNKNLEPEVLAKPCRGDMIRNRWRACREALRLPNNLHYYDMKYTGITDMADEAGSRATQLQARHSSVTMTERYMQDKHDAANPVIKKYR